MNRHVRKKIRTTYQNNGSFILKLVRIIYHHTYTHTPQMKHLYKFQIFSGVASVHIGDNGDKWI